jgi:hypothetical protein
MRLTALTAAVLLTASPALAEFQPVADETQFRTLVSGKTLTRPLVKLEVSPEGQIAGIGAAWEVTGNWSWQEGYFCRDLFWGGDPLGFNCQAVYVHGDRIRFKSDRGQGDYADFRVR